jgi:hypothetical protein
MNAYSSINSIDFKSLAESKLNLHRKNGTKSKSSIFEVASLLDVFLEKSNNLKQESNSLLHQNGFSLN